MQSIKTQSKVQFLQRAVHWIAHHMSGFISYEKCGDKKVHMSHCMPFLNLKHTADMERVSAGSRGFIDDVRWRSQE